jgi:hypothetical protein
MSRTLKNFHLFSLGFGFLATIALIFNLVFLSLLYPLITGFQELAPTWETLGIVAALNIIVIALFHLSSVLTLLIHLILQKQTSTLKIAAISLGVISGVMILGDIALLSDISKEYLMGWQTRGEWIILFISYGLHVLYIALGMYFLFTNLEKEQPPVEQTVKDEVLFLSLLSTGWICGCLGLLAVIAALFTTIPSWIMVQAIPTFGSIILSPYCLILGIWLFRSKLERLSSWLDEKQYQDIARASLWTLLITFPLVIVFYGLQFHQGFEGNWNYLWFPAYLFTTLLIFSSLAQSFYRN